MRNRFENVFSQDPLFAGCPNSCASSHSKIATHSSLFDYHYDLSRNNLSAELRENLDRLARLMANAVEAYSSVIFLSNAQRKEIIVGGYHTLSRHFLPSARIGYGHGLVGWCIENGTSITVCPFEADPSTLMYYNGEASLKSFIAMPIFNTSKKILGVVVCDSKKNYAFPKITEKILVDFAEQCASVVSLVNKLDNTNKDSQPPLATLSTWLQNLQRTEKEEDLLSIAIQMPCYIPKRDGLAVVLASELGVGSCVFRTKCKSNSIESKLLDLVFRHKRIVYTERLVHLVAQDDTRDRSFLSVALTSLGEEIGSINLLSESNESFSVHDIEILEHAAKVISDKLEHLRLRERFSVASEISGFLPPRFFLAKSSIVIKESKDRKVRLSLLRISVIGVHELEKLLGFVSLEKGINRLLRLINQVRCSSSIACRISDTSVILLTESIQAKRIAPRLRSLMAKANVATSMGSDMSHDAQTKTIENTIEVGVMLSSKLSFHLVDVKTTENDLANSVNETLDKLLEETNVTHVRSPHSKFGVAINV